MDLRTVNFSFPLERLSDCTAVRGYLGGWGHMAIHGYILIAPLWISGVAISLIGDTRDTNTWTREIERPTC